MHIDTTSAQNLQSSVCACLDIGYYDLYKELNRLCDIRNANSNACLDDPIKKFINSHNLKMPDEMEFYHLGWRLSDDACEEGKNLRELVLMPNSFSLYLKNHGFAFSDAETLKVTYQGKEILNSGNSSNRVENYLRMRLGVDGDAVDYCVNGFAFRDSLEKVSYWENLSSGPEFLQKLSEYIDDHSLIDNYVKSGKYYCFKYNVPLDDIIFDARQDATNLEKIYCFLNQCFQHLLCYHTNPQFKDFNDSDNICLRLNDSAALKKEWFDSKEPINV